MLRSAWRLCVWTLAIVGFVALAAALSFVSGGISAKTSPGRLESAIARRARSFLSPREIKSRPNAVPVTADAIASGMRHFADHRAVCHANNGSGDASCE
jgi:hypothetical protein